VKKHKGDKGLPTVLLSILDRTVPVSLCHTKTGRIESRIIEPIAEALRQPANKKSSNHYLRCCIEDVGNQI
jgi:hypothetical protein